MGSFNEKFIDSKTIAKSLNTCDYSSYYFFNCQSNITNFQYHEISIEFVQKL
jgi:hypothetical protein